MALDVTLFEDPYEAIHFQKLLQEMGVMVYIIMTNFDLVSFWQKIQFYVFLLVVKLLLKVAKP